MFRTALRAIGVGFRPFLVLSVLTGAIYPALVTAVAQLTFPFQASGSILTVDGQDIGSALIGQPFHDPRYFWSRPSATATPYDPSGSAASNLGPSNPLLDSLVRARVRDLGGGPVPVDLVTTSASGLDPDITPAAAIFQVGRVARVRRIDSIAVAKLVRRHVQNRIWNVLGEPRVNVLRLNVGLDSLASALQSRPTQ